MPYTLACPACNSKLAVEELVDEITMIQCSECGKLFAAQHPSTLKKPSTLNKKKKAKAKAAAAAAPPLSLELLAQADDVTSQAVIAAFSKSASFKAFSKAEMEQILARDAEDDEKLAEGIRLAVAKGAVEASPPVEPITEIDVLGKSADDVALDIVGALGDAPGTGCVLVLQGLSGTGKGTTVAKLQRLLPNASAWSNGNIFRAITLLAVTYCETHGLTFSADVLSPNLLAELVGCLHFERIPSSKPGAPPEFDVRIDGLGIKAYISTIATTLLKEPKVGKSIPTVAKVTQGEVISFAAKCAETMRAAGCNVLIEGRAQTLDHVRTPFRFELTLSKPLLIGHRRAAQRMVGKALEALKAAPPAEAASGEVVHAALTEALEALAAGSN